MTNRLSARLAGAFLLCAVPALQALAQSRSEPDVARTEVAVARPVGPAHAVLFDSAPCIGDDDFHRFDGSPIPGAGLPEPVPVTRVVIAGPESVRERSRRTVDRSRATR
jgi:hypothetical protein